MPIMKMGEAIADLAHTRHPCHAHQRQKMYARHRPSPTNIIAGDSTLTATMATLPRCRHPFVGMVISAGARSLSCTIATNREQNPEKNTNHYIDAHNHYHIVQTVDRSPPNVQALGFVVQTREPGRYPVVLEIITDCGEAKSFIKLHVIVNEPAPDDAGKRLPPARLGVPAS